MTHKRCPACGETKPFTEFHKNKAAKGGLQVNCKPCHMAKIKKYHDSEKGRDATLRAQRKYLASEHGHRQTKLSTAAWRAEAGSDEKRRPMILRATPAWADAAGIEAVYVQAAKNALAGSDLNVVDHIVPLNSPLVCGLHVASNLQIITKSENSRKGNRRWPDMPDDPQDVARFFGIRLRGKREG